MYKKSMDRVNAYHVTWRIEEYVVHSIENHITALWLFFMNFTSCVPWSLKVVLPFQNRPLEVWAVSMYLSWITLSSSHFVWLLWSFYSIFFCSFMGFFELLYFIGHILVILVVSYLPKALSLFLFFPCFSPFLFAMFGWFNLVMELCCALIFQGRFLYLVFSLIFFSHSFVY